MNRIKSPQFLQDLVRDLRDRRLLLPAAALLIALLAVPVLLSSSSEPAPAAPVAAAPPRSAEAVAPAVLAEQNGIRDYRKRLDALAKKDPFDQKFAAPDPEDVAIEESVSGTTSSTGTTPPTSSAPAAPSLEDALAEATGSSSPADTGDSTPTTVTEPQGGSGNSSNGDAGQRKPEIRFYAGRVDIAFGAAGDAKVLEGVRELDFIPGDKNPVAAFIGLAGNGDHAVFGLTPSIVETRGDGSCAPQGPGCQFLRLGEGQTRYLKTDSGETLKLKLIATDLVPIADPRD